MALNITEDMVHILLVGLSSAVLLVSIAAQLRKRNRRYQVLTLAFGFLTLSQSVELVETLFMSNQLVMVPIAGNPNCHGKEGR